jgi:hypothetical protein
MAALLLCLALAAGAEAGSPARDFLRAFPGVTEADLREADQGEVVARVLDTPHRKEVLALSLVRLPTASRERVRTRFLDVAALKKMQEDLADAGALGAVPDAEDLARVPLDGGDVEAVRRCRPGDCSLKLPASVQERLRRAQDGPPEQADARLAAELHEVLAEWARGYLEQGNRALPTYEDRPTSVSAGARAAEILDRTPGLAVAAPELDAYLRGYPDPRPGGLQDLLFWSREAFWKRKVLTLGHLVVYEPPEARPRRVWRVAKQLFAKHYFEGALHVSVFVESPEGGGYLAVLQRFETDHKRGGFNFLERALINRSARRRLERQEEAWRQRLEATTRP